MFDLNSVIFSVTGLFLAIGLFFDVKKRLQTSKNQKPTSAIESFFLNFSPLTNFEKIHKFPMPTKKPNYPDLSVLNAIRVFTILWVILGHCLVFTQSILDNGRSAKNMMTRFTFQVMNNAYLAVDTFFFLSGFLGYWSLVRRMKHPKFRFWFRLPVIYLYRYLRITIPHVALILLVAGIWPHIGTGPFYFQGTDYSCAKNWWVNLLYLNNFIDYTRQCVVWSWYLMVDMQVFLLLPFAVFLFIKEPIFGWGYTMAGVAAQIAIDASMTMVYKLPFTLDEPANYQENLEITGYEEKAYNKFFGLFYIKPYTRMGPYIVGVIFCHILVAHQKTVEKMTRNKLVNRLGWLISIGMVLAIVYGPYEIFAGYRLEPLWEDAIYNALARMAWAVPLGWMVLSCSTGNGGVIGNMMAWNGFSIPARLSYAAYLLHPMVLTYFTQTSRRPFHVTDMNLIFLFCGTTLVTFMLSTVFSIAFESPLVGFLKGLH